MSIPTEFFHWWIIDERTGERRLTTYKLSRADAERAFPGASQTCRRARSATSPSRTGCPPTADRRGP